MERLDNMYYQQYANIVESEPNYDSDCDASRSPLLASEDNTVIVYRDDSEYMQRRKKQELLHRNWTSQRRYLTRRCQKRMGEDVRVRAGDKVVEYTYVSERYELLGTTFAFRVILVYRSLLRKWYISTGRSRVPNVIEDVVELGRALASGTYNPLSDKVLNMIRDVRRATDAFTIRSTILHRLVHDARDRHEDIQFILNPTLTKMTLIFTGNAWPNGMRRSSREDAIVAELTLDKHIRVLDISYEYIYPKIRAARDARTDTKELQDRLRDFLQFPLKEALKRFMGQQESLEGEDRRGSSSI